MTGGIEYKEEMGNVPVAGVGAIRLTADHDGGMLATDTAVQDRPAAGWGVWFVPGAGIRGCRRPLVPVGRVVWGRVIVVWGCLAWSRAAGPTGEMC